MHLAVRAWSAAGFGNTDPGLRVLGLYVGLFLLLAFWFASWTMRGGAPLLAVTLAGLNVTIVRAGDSLRGYGLGSALAVLTLAAIWRLTYRPSLAAFSCAVALAVLSVQSLYQNAFLLFAACCGGFVLCTVERRWRDTLPIFAVGVAAAVSLLPYVPLIASAHWYDTYKVGFRFSYGWKQLSEAFGSPLTGFTWVWVAIWIGALATAISVLFWRRDRVSDRVRGLVLFAGTSMVLGAAGYAVLSKAGAAAYTSVALRAADGFFRRLFRRSSSRSVALDATRSDDPGSSNNFYDLSIRVARGEMPPDERRSHRRQSFQRGGSK